MPSRTADTPSSRISHPRSRWNTATQSQTAEERDKVRRLESKRRGRRVPTAPVGPPLYFLLVSAGALTPFVAAVGLPHRWLSHATERRNGSSSFAVAARALRWSRTAATAARALRWGESHRNHNGAEAL
eukprot:scaffold70891_cov31-Tisochrysis_lutea.AAC.1